MNSERPLQSSEHKLDDLMYSVDAVAEALIEAEPPQEDFVWLVRVLGGELPGQDIAYNIELLEKIEFSIINDVDAKIKTHIAEALDLLRAKYRADVENTAQELNTLIATRPDTFVVSETGGTLVSLLFQQKGSQTVAVELNTTLGPVVVDGDTQVHVDVNRLSPEERASIRAYERRYGL